MVNVIMPAYNARRTIEESVRSVLAQTFTSWELFIIDDGSTDGTDFTQFTDPRIRVYHNECNSGVAYSRNFGVNQAKGEYIAFLDADDLWTLDKLSKQLVFMSEKNAQISYTASAFIDANGNKYDYVMPAVPELSPGELLKRNLMSCSSVLVKRELIEKYPFPKRSLIHEDFVSWVRIVRETGTAYGLNEPLLLYRLSAGSKSAGRVRSARMTYNAYREIGYNAARSACMTARYAIWSIYKRRLIRNALMPFQ